MKNFYRRHKTVINTVCIILVTVLVVGIIGVMTNGFAKVQNNSFLGLRKPNEKNLITIKDYDALDGTKTNGIKIVVAEDGTISLTGKADVDTSIILKTFAVEHAMITKPDDGYTLSGVTSGSLKSVYLQVAQNDNVLARSTKYGANFTCEAVAEVTVTIEIVEGTELENFKLNPVVVPGSTAESFYK